MRTALALSLAVALATLSGCSQGVAEGDAASAESRLSAPDTEALGRRLATFTGRWLTEERRPDQVDVVVRTFDDERGGYNTDVRFETTNLVLRYMRFAKIDGGEVYWRNTLATKIVEGTAISKLSADGRTLTNTESERTTDRGTNVTTETLRVQTLALEGEKLHYTDVVDGATKSDLVLVWDDKQPPRTSSN